MRLSKVCDCCCCYLFCSISCVSFPSQASNPSPQAHTLHWRKARSKRLDFSLRLKRKERDCSPRCDGFKAWGDANCWLTPLPSIGMRTLDLWFTLHQPPTQGRRLSSSLPIATLGSLLPCWDFGWKHRRSAQYNQTWHCVLPSKKILLNIYDVLTSVWTIYWN